MSGKSRNTVRYLTCLAGFLKTDLYGYPAHTAIVQCNGTVLGAYGQEDWPASDKLEFGGQSPETIRNEHRAYIEQPLAIPPKAPLEGSCQRS